jgi:hypothetical protein
MDKEKENMDDSVIEPSTEERPAFLEWFSSYAKVLLLRALSYGFFLAFIYVFCISFYKLFFVYHFLGLAFKVALGNVPFSSIPLAVWGWLVAWLISWAAISLEVNIAERQIFGPRR